MPKAHITPVGGGGSQVGLSDVEAGAVQIGDSDVPIGIGQSDLIDHTVAVVAFAIIINNSVTGVDSLTTQQLRDIYSGTITNWKQVNGPDMSIDLLIRSADSGSRSTLEQYVLRFTHKLGRMINEGQMEGAVQESRGAIGYVDLGTAIQNKDKAKIVSIDGNSPMALDLVKNNTYKFWNYEHMFTKGLAHSDSLTYAFIQYMTSSSADAFIAKLSYINFNDMLESALIDHNKVRTVP